MDETPGMGDEALPGSSRSCRVRTPNVISVMVGILVVRKKVSQKPSAYEMLIQAAGKLISPTTGISSTSTVDVGVVCSTSAERV